MSFYNAADHVLFDVWPEVLFELMVLNRTFLTVSQYNYILSYNIFRMLSVIFSTFDKIR